jgi:hypothetical protein
MVITIYPKPVRLFPLTWHRHRLTVASTSVSTIQYGKAHPRLDASCSDAFFVVVVLGRMPLSCHKLRNAGQVFATNRETKIFVTKYA